MIISQSNVNGFSVVANPFSMMLDENILVALPPMQASANLAPPTIGHWLIFQREFEVNTTVY